MAHDAVVLDVFEHVAAAGRTAAVTGLTPGGEPAEGNCKFTDEFPIAEGFQYS